MAKRFVNAIQTRSFRSLIHRAVYEYFEIPARRLILQNNVTHVSGRQTIDYGNNELVVVCLVRDGEIFLKSFIEHYFELGVKHIIFLDNKSVDKTVEFASSYNNVTVLQSDLSFKKYQRILRSYLINRFSKGKWCLCVDIDELFDYPYSDVLDLESFICYLNENGFSAVVSQMLDMFNDKPLLSKTEKSDDSLRGLYRFYDLSSIRQEDYNYQHFGDTNSLANPEIKLHLGGIRQQIFDLGDMYLTKHPLIRLDGTLQPMRTEHTLRYGIVADVTCVLYHYRFLNNFMDYVIRERREENFYKDSIYWKQIYRVLKDDPNINLKKSTSLELSSVNDLLASQFIVVSDNFRKWAKDTTHSCRE